MLIEKDLINNNVSTSRRSNLNNIFKIPHVIYFICKNTIQQQTQNYDELLSF